MNEPLPVEVNETFWTAQDGQAEFCLAIYEHMGREGHSNVELSNTVKVRDVIHPLRARPSEKAETRRVFCVVSQRDS